MKSLILITILISVNAFSAFTPKSTVCSSGDKSWHRSKVKCEKINAEECIEVSTKVNVEYCSVVEEEIIDFTKPIYATRSMIEGCVSLSDCQEKAGAKNQKKPSDCIVDDERITCKVQNCAEERSSMYNKEFSEVWCSKVTGHEMKKTGNTVVQEDETKKATYESEQAIKAAQENAVKNQLKYMEIGKVIYAKITLLNLKKGLTRAERKALRNSLADIRADFFDGDLCSAREGVQAITPSGKTTQEDLDAVVALIDAEISCQ